MVLGRVAAAALFAIAVFFSVSAEAGVTYVFQPLTLEQSLNSYTQVPLPISGPIGSMTITDAAFAERKIDNYLDIESFFFNVPGGYPFLAITNLTPCQLPTIKSNCTRGSQPISMTLSENGEIESGFITYHGVSYYGHDLEYFDSDRTLRMNGSDGDWTGLQVTETGTCGQNPGCLFTGEWVPIPEPATASLLAAGMGFAFWLRRRRGAA